MKTLIYAAVLASLPLQAEELQFALTGTAFIPDSGSYPGAGPFAISFVLDTQSGTPSFLFDGGCLQHFDVNGASLSNLNVSINGQSLFSGNSTTSYGGDSTNGSCSGPLIAALNLNGNFWEFDPSPGMSQVDFSASSDPVAALFLNFQQYPSYGQYDGYNLSFDKVSVTTVRPADVPEPGTLALLLLGLASLLFLRSWRRARD